MNKHVSVVCVCAALAVMVISLLPSSPALGQAPATQVWEYKVVNIGFHSGSEAKLNDLGKDRWELISVATENGVAFFKRPK